MKTSLTITFSVALLIAAGITLADSEEICGTWINTEYYKGVHSYKDQKIIFSPDQTIRIYRDESLPTPDCEGNYNIAEKWTDTEKNIWYKVKRDTKCHGDRRIIYYLIRIRDSGKTLEFVYHPVDYHKELDSNHPSYRIYYRK